MEILPWVKLILLASQFLLCQADPMVSTSNGEIKGSCTLRTRNGTVIYSFTGIPYAKPPVGPLRFKDPQPAERWNEPYDGTKTAFTCPELKSISCEGGYLTITGQEDCLYLNVYSPKLDEDAKLPVIIFIHGGSFKEGSGGIYGPEFLLDRDVVLVTINYRLGVLGFLSTGDDTIPANLGLKDQSLAIKWVHNNVEKFGGDSNLVTVFGQSAGGASAHLHLLSPLNKGLIHRAIAMSGTAFSPWVLNCPQLLKDKTKALATLVGCFFESGHKLLECMQTVPVDTLLEIGARFQDWLITPLAPFGPTIESKKAKGAFLTSDPERLESQVPFMTGVTSGDGGIAASSVFGIGGRYEDDLRDRTQYILQKLLFLREKFPSHKVPEVSQKIQDFYFGNKSVDRNVTTEIINMVTDSWFVGGAVEAAKNYSGNAYFYYSDYVQSVSFCSIFRSNDLKGVCHVDDLLSIFPLTTVFPDRKLSQTDNKVSDQVLDLWTNFAKTGVPSFGGLQWKPMGKSSRSNEYLHITADDPKVEKDFLPERVKFWTSLKEEEERCKTPEQPPS